MVYAVAGVLVIALGACVRTAGAPHESSPAHPSSSARWSGGVTILAGQRYVAEANGIGWILTRPTSNGELAVTKLSLSDGGATTTLADSQMGGASYRQGLATDPHGHLWLTYGEQILRIDEQGGGVQRWDLPSPPPDAAPSDEHPEAGHPDADYWDVQNNDLLLLREDDHRLYRFDPASGSLTTAADLPVTTTYLSSFAVAGDGSIGINGSLVGATAFTPTAAILPKDADAWLTVPNVLAVCGAPSGIATLDPKGAVAIVSSATNALGQIGFTPRTDTPLVCDAQGDVFSDGDVFSPDGSKGSVAIVRLSPTGQISTVNPPLTPTTVEGHVPGATPIPTWAGPDLRALLPDGQGGVWLVSSDGQDEEGRTSAYPSLWRASFSP